MALKQMAGFLEGSLQVLCTSSVWNATRTGRVQPLPVYDKRSKPLPVAFTVACYMTSCKMASGGQKVVDGFQALACDVLAEQGRHSLLSIPDEVASREDVIKFLAWMHANLSFLKKNRFVSQVSVVLFVYTYACYK